MRQKSSMRLCADAVARIARDAVLQGAGQALAILGDRFGAFSPGGGDALQHLGKEGRP